ncbi:hypothetical protein ABT026_20365 [Streptomyces sp. NPDC002734]|uniref:RNA polymerase sigma factor n=1 Tax=Streptomyces sp. NPDC002734 TaxID=3154426 RepID=UPI003319602F
MVGGEARVKASATADLEKQLLDAYPEFMAAAPSLLRRKAGNKLSEATCQDIVHEAFERVRAKITAGKLGATVNLHGYLQRTTWNVALDVLRAQSRRPVVHDTDLMASLSVQRSLDVDPMEELVRPAIEAMSPTRRRRVVQMQSEGLDDASIAEELGIAPDRLHKDRSAAVNELRDKLSPNIRDGHRRQTQRMKKDG